MLDTTIHAALIERLACYQRLREHEMIGNPDYKPLPWDKLQDSEKGKWRIHATAVLELLGADAVERALAAKDNSARAAEHLAAFESKRAEVLRDAKGAIAEHEKTQALAKAHGVWFDPETAA